MSKNELITSEAAEFSYASVDKETESKLRYCAKEILKHKSNFAVSVLAIGETLAIAHEQLAKCGSGTFLKWVETECGFSKSSAYNYMAAFKVFGTILPIVGKMEDVAIYALASKDTPEKARKEVIRLVEKGAKITQKQAKAIIKKHKSSAPSPAASPSESGSSSVSPPEPAKPELTKEEQLKAELKKARSYAEYLQRSIDDLNRIKRNTVIHPQCIKACGQILEGLQRW